MSVVSRIATITITNAAAGAVATCVGFVWSGRTGATWAS